MNIFNIPEVVCKLGNMRKADAFTVCPKDKPESREVIIQSDKRIAKINLDTKKAMLSNGKGGHPGFHKLLPFLGAVEVDVPQEVIDQLNSYDIPAGSVRVL